ncbi:hypothetical protein CU044_2734 [Streptomyces sp. L-9-10]|nr:hypothetical protein CU044_2734 [Streptomyces sp. L-9-10]
MNSRPVIRQRHRRVKTRQTNAPELLRHPHITPRHPPGLNTQPTTTHHHRQHQPIPSRRIVVEDEGEHPRDAPAVEQDVVEGEQDADTALTEPGQGQPRQRHPAQIQTPLVVGGQQGFPAGVLFRQEAVAPVQDLDRQTYVPVNHLYRFGHALPHETDPQRLYLVDHALPGRGEPVDVRHPVDHVHQLLEVGRPVRLGEGVEEHPGLQRHQRQDILDTTPVTDRRVQTRLIQRRQRKVRRRDTTGTRQLTMRQETLQLSHERRRQPLHHRLGEHTGRPDEVDQQPAVRDPGCHIEGVVTTGEQAGVVLDETDLLERPLWGGARARRTARDGVELTEVVEADLWVDRGDGAAQMAQRAVAQTTAGHRTQPLLGGLDEDGPVGLARAAVGAGSRLRTGRQLQGEDGGEPAHGPGQVEIQEDLFPAVPLDVHEDAVLAGPAAEDAGEYGEEHLVDPRAVHRGHLVQESAGGVGRQLGRGGGRCHGLGRGGGRCHGLGRVGRSRARGLLGRGRHTRQFGPYALADSAPVLQLRVETTRFHMRPQPRSPLLERRGTRTQIHHRPRHQLPIRQSQILQQHPPRHPVDHGVVDQQHQSVAVLPEPEGQRAEQRSLGEVQRVAGDVREPVHLGLPLTGGELREVGVFRVRVGTVRRVGDVLRPYAGLVAYEAQPQRVMVSHQGGHRFRERVEVRTGGECGGHRHVEPVRGAGRAPEEPLLDGRETYRALDGCEGLGSGRVGRPVRRGDPGQVLGQGPYRLAVEHVLG